MGGIAFWELVSSLFNWLMQNWYVLLIPFAILTVVCSFQFWKDNIEEDK